MEQDLQSFFWIPVYSCTHWLDSGTPPPPILPHSGSYTRALLVSQDRRHVFVTPWVRRKLSCRVTCLSLRALAIGGARSISSLQFKNVPYDRILGHFLPSLVLVQHTLPIREKKIQFYNQLSSKERKNLAMTSFLMSAILEIWASTQSGQSWSPHRRNFISETTPFLHSFCSMHTVNLYKVCPKISCWQSRELSWRAPAG